MHKVFKLNETSDLLLHCDTIIKSGKADNYIIELKMDRSGEQNRWYHGVLLPTLLDNLSEVFLERHPRVNNVTVLDSYLSEQFALYKFGEKMFKVYTDIHGVEYVKCMFDKSFSKCSQELFQEFLDFVDTKIYEMTNIYSINDLLIKSGKPIYTKKTKN